MIRLLWDSCYVLNSATDHFVAALKISEKGYFRLAEFRQFAHVSVRVVAMVKLSQSIS